jgi:hypothetical protein
VPGASGQGHADQRDFEGVLRAAFARGEVLNWTGGNVRLERPIVIEVTHHIVGRDLNVARFEAPLKSAISRASLSASPRTTRTSRCAS